MMGYMFVDEGQEVIVPDLFWGNYNLILTNAYGANLVKFNTFKNNGFDVDALKVKLLAEGDKKIVILNFPNNPTGYTPTTDEMKAIVSVVKEAAEAGKKVVAVTDDAYFGLVYEEGVAGESVFTELADLHENVLAVKVDGPTKEDYVWGFRVGFISYAYKGCKAEVYSALESKTAGAVRGNISNAANISQSLLLSAFESPGYNEEKARKYDIMKARYDAVKEALKNDEYKAYFNALPFNSGYFMCVKLKEGMEADKVRQILIEKYSIGLIALGNILRIAFSAVAASDIDAMFQGIYNACVDAEGCIWSAHWNGWRVVRYDPDGNPILQVDVPAQRVTSCCFGGKNLSTLFITTAREGL